MCPKTAANYTQKPDNSQELFIYNHRWSVFEPTPPRLNTTFKSFIIYVCKLIVSIKPNVYPRNLHMHEGSATCTWTCARLSSAVKNRVNLCHRRNFVPTFVSSFEGFSYKEAGILYVVKCYRIFGTRTKISPGYKRGNNPHVTLTLTRLERHHVRDRIQTTF